MTILIAQDISSKQTPVGGSTDGQISNSAKPKVSTSENIKGNSGEKEFRSMVSRELKSAAPQDDTQAIENKDLKALNDKLEDHLELLADEENVDAEWLQFLKSHFQQMPDESVISSELGKQGIALDEANTHNGVILNTPASESDSLMKGKSVLADGEVLPGMRQQEAAGQQPLTPEEQSSLNSDARKINIPTPKSTDSGNQSTQVAGITKSGLTESALATDQSSEMNDAEPQRSDFGKDKSFIRDNVASGFKSAENLSVAHNNSVLNMPSAGSLQSALPSALQTLSLQPQAQTSVWGDAIGERVSFLINNKLNRAEIRIDPPHLGKLDIQIQVKDDSALVTIHTQHVQTRDLIDSASVRLRDFLQDAGYSSVDVNVSHREQNDQQDGFSQHNDFSDAESDLAENSNQESTELHSTGLNNSDQIGVIDYFA